MPTTHADALTARLREVVSVVQARSAVLERLIGRIDVDCTSQEEFEADCLSSAFLAFVMVGGDGDHPDMFDWQGRRDEVIELTRLELRRVIRGRNTRYHDHRLRRGRRQTLNQVHRWTSWQFEHTPPGKVRPSQMHNVGITFETPQETDLTRRQFLDLEQELRLLLRPKDFHLLRLHYVSGVAQRKIADQLDVDENLVNQWLSRARRRARKALSGRWQMLLSEAA